MSAARALVLLAALAATAALAAPVAAQPAPPGPPKTAAEHYEAGRRLYDVKEYAAAIAEFKVAYTLDPDPVYLFNLAQAYRLQGDCASAEEFFRKFLKGDPTTDRRTKIEKLIAECKPTETDIVSPAPDRGQPVQPPAPLPPPPSDPGRGRRIIGIITAAGGLGLVAGGGVLAASAASIQSDLETECAMRCDWADVRGRDSTARTRSTLSTVAFVTGGAAVIGGVALYFWGRSMHPESPVAIVPTRGGAIATAGFAF